MIYLFRELDSFSEELFRKALDMLPPGDVYKRQAYFRDFV